ncbi:hypothetical protein OK351_10095 [Glutamicibacter sp. MNS18]|uniref:hypothetical protein n=1 Tax=Glutamicibacter sp. MNS18 TaxID=2989817 RepID=UPI0022363002|nr:hypothetical protein [Glutamicibacter sp. MNS18]MCW4465855.1 hypothetical protein [Glutamicibacter sp. MNS18]
MVLLVLTVACTAEPTEGPSGPIGQWQTATIQGLTWEDGSEIQASVLDLDSAEEKIIGDFFGSYASVDGWAGSRERFGPLALTEHGDLVGEFSVALEPTRDDTDLSSHGAIGMVRAGEFEPFASTETLVAGDGNRMVMSAAAADDMVVWVETAHYGDATDKWRIFAGGAGKETELMAKAEDYSDFLHRPPFNQNPAPVIDDGIAYWQGLLDDGEGKLSVSVFAQHGTEGRGAEIVVRDANNPVVLDSGIAVTDTMVDLDPGEEVDPVQSPIRGKGISIFDGNTRTPLLEMADPADPRTELGGLSGGGQTLITTVNEQLLVIDVETRQVSVVSAPEAETEGFTFFAAGPEVCGDYATWTYTDPAGRSNGMQYFLKLDTLELGRITEENLFGKVFCNDDYFAWLVLDGADSGAIAHAEVMEWKGD